MMVLLVSNGFPPSGQWGTEYYTHQLATGLVARGHEVTVFCPLRDGSRPRYTIERGERYGIRTIEIHNTGDPRKSFADSYRNRRMEAFFAEIIDELQPDVVHFTHLLWGLSIGLPRVAAERGCRTVVTLTDFGLLCHRGQLFDARLEPCGGPKSDEDCARCIRQSGPFEGAGLTRIAKGVATDWLAAVGGGGMVVTEREVRARRLTIDVALSAVDHFIAPTRTLAETFERAGLPSGDISQLSYGVDEELYRSARGWRDPATYRFGFLGQFEPHKGLHRLFDAVRILNRRLPESLESWSVHLFGNPVGGRHRRYVTRIWSDDLSERIRFRGSFEPIKAPNILASLDAVVVPSQWTENAPLTVLQARIAGLPVVASDVPGIREVLDAGPHASLVSPQEPESLADALGDFLRRRPDRDLDSRAVIGYQEHLEKIEAIYRARPPLVATCAPFSARTGRPASGARIRAETHAGQLVGP